MQKIRAARPGHWFVLALAGLSLIAGCDKPPQEEVTPTAPPAAASPTERPTAHPAPAPTPASPARSEAPAAETPAETKRQQREGKPQPAERPTAPAQQPAAQPAARPQPARASTPPPASGSFTVPVLTDEQMRQFPMSLELKIRGAQAEAQKSPDDPLALGRLGAFYYAHGYPTEAARVLAHGAQVTPDEPQWGYYAALGYLKAGETQKAAPGLEQMIEARPDYMPAYLRLAEVLRASDPQRARELYTHVLAADPVNGLALVGVGRIAAQQGRNEEALEYFEKAAGLIPNYADALQGAAETARKLGQTEKAEQYAQRAEEGLPYPPIQDPLENGLLGGGLHAETLARDAMALATQGRHQEAEARLQAALEIGGADVMCFFAVASLRASQQRFDEALRAAERGLESAPDHIDLKSVRAQILVDLGRTQEAEAQFREILKQQPTHGLTLQRLFALLQRQDRAGEAVELLRAAVQEDPDDARRRHNLAQYLLATNQPAEAVEQLKQALELQPQAVPSRYLLAMTLHGQGAQEEAKAQVRRALQTNPKFGEAYQQLAYWLRAEGDLRGALEVVREGLNALPTAPTLLNTAAWLLATAPDEALRDPAQAVKYGEQACHLTEGRVHLFLDTLAAAYAAAGNFQRAREVEQEAISLATQADPQQAEKYRQRLKLYEQEQPFVDQ